MKKMTLVVVLLMGMTLVWGCQKQGKPKHAKTVKGLERIHFDFDQAEITSESKQSLKNNAKYLKENDGTRVTIEGHCDERGSEEYNIALGHRRADSTKNYVVSLGVDSKRLETKSYGEERPADKCHNESCWWKNRRADFVKR